MERCTFCFAGKAVVQVRGRHGDTFGHWANSCAECLAGLVTGSPHWTSFEFRGIEDVAKPPIVIAEQNVLAEDIWLPWEERVRALEHRGAVNKTRLGIQGRDFTKLTDRVVVLEKRTELLREQVVLLSNYLVKHGLQPLPKA